MENQIEAQNDVVQVMPSDVLFNLHKVCVRGDIAAFIPAISKRVLEFHQKDADAQGISIDEYVRRNFEFPLQLRHFTEILNEEIVCNEAIIDFRCADSGYIARALFAKEEGQWKYVYFSSTNAILGQQNPEQSEIKPVGWFRGFLNDLFFWLGRI